LDEKYRKLFKKVGNEYRYSRLGHNYQKTEELGKGESYFPEDRKLVCNETPRSISIAALAEIIKTQKVIFYTGAGISAGAVPTMDELKKDLKVPRKLEKGRSLQNYVAEIIENPDLYAEVLQKFYDKCENAEQTVAHHELAKMVQHYKHILTTENLE
jgi:hypothetical protein